MEILLLDIGDGGAAETVWRNLDELNTGGYTARTFGTLAAAMGDGVLYLAGAAKAQSFFSDYKKVFPCTVPPEDTAPSTWPQWWKCHPTQPARPRNPPGCPAPPWRRCRSARRERPGPLPPGTTSLDLEAAGGLPSGMYVIRIEGWAPDVVCRKAVLLR